MSRRGAGVSLVALAGVLYAARYLSAAIFASSGQSWNAETFRAMLGYVGSALLWWSALALAAGVAYLVWGEVQEVMSQRGERGERTPR